MFVYGLWNLLLFWYPEKTPEASYVYICRLLQRNPTKGPFDKLLITITNTMQNLIEIVFITHFCFIFFKSKYLK